MKKRAPHLRKCGAFVSRCAAVTLLSYDAGSAKSGSPVYEYCTEWHFLSTRQRLFKFDILLAKKNVKKKCWTFTSSVSRFFYGFLLLFSFNFFFIFLFFYINIFLLLLRCLLCLLAKRCFYCFLLARSDAIHLWCDATRRIKNQKREWSIAALIKCPLLNS